MLSDHGSSKSGLITVIGELRGLALIGEKVYVLRQKGFT